MPVTIHLCNETSAWRYLVPALFNFSEVSNFSWEVCRYPEGFLDADKALLRENQNVFSFLPLGREAYVAKWMQLHGAPSPEIMAYCWGTTNESPIKSVPFIHLPALCEDLNGFLLHLKSVHPLRSLNSLVNERAVHPRDRLWLREILSEKLTAALAKQLTAASLLQSCQPVVIAEEASPLHKAPGRLAHPATIEVDEVDPPKLRFLLDELELSLTTEEGDKSGNYLEGFTETESEHCPHWSSSFVDNPHLPILTHIEKYGCITEAEIIKMLDSPRASRVFTTKLEAYAKILPFEIKVQPSPTGSRYVRN